MKGKRIKAVLIAALIAVTAMTPMQALAYSADQVGKLDNQVKVESTLNFNDNQKVPVTLNGLPVNMKTPAYVTGGRTLLPVRGVAELLSAQVNFQPNGEPGLIQITKDANEVLLQLGRNKLIKNGTMTSIDSANPKIGASTFKGTTNLPLRAVASALGVQVAYENGKVNIITTAGEVVVPPVSGQNLVPNTNPELVTTMMDANSPKIEGDMWTVPQGLIYKNPAGLKPGDKLSNEQKDRMLIHFKGASKEVIDGLHAKDYIYLPPGTKIALDDRKTSWIFNDISYQGVLGYGFRDAKSVALSPTNAWDGIVAFKDGSRGSISAGACEKITKMGLDKINYAIYDTGTDYSYVTFYN